MLVLLIDDDPRCLELIIYLLEPFGFRVIATASARQGIELAIKERPCIVLCDMHMPEWNGYDFAEKFLENKNLQDIPLVAITGAHSIFGDRLAVLEAGYRDVLYKPLTESVVPKIKSLCLNREY